MARETTAAESSTTAVKSALIKRRIVMVLVAAVVIPVAVTVVHTYPPDQYPIYPPCYFHYFTGWHCPGCGATRSVGALVRGDVEQAFAYNVLFMLFLPLLAYGVLGATWELWTGRRRRRIPFPDWAAIALVVLLLAYFVARNIDVYPLTLLAPHQIERVQSVNED